MVFVNFGNLFIFAAIGIVVFLFFAAVVRASVRKNVPRNLRGRREAHPTYRLAEPPDDDWLCANPKCFAKNPGHARYCRMCSRPGPRCDPYH